MRAAIAFFAILLGLNFTNPANAQSANYTVTLKNNATYPMYGEYDTPTTTGGMSQIWFPAEAYPVVPGSPISSGYTIWAG
jgi:predicted enzyme related to lactoylglutathione lyase